MHLVEDEEPVFVPQMLAQLEDELARSRMREAFWISVIVHIVFVLLIVFSPDWMPNWAQPHLLRAEDLARTKEPTYLELPQDLQKPPAKVHADKLSDKNRIAQTTHPQIDQKTLDALREAARLRGNQTPPGAPAARPAMPDGGTPPANSQSANNFPQQRVQPNEQTAENPFQMPGSAGAAIAQAAHNARKGFGGGGGGYGMGSSDRVASVGGFDVLSDTQGVDFAPYLARIRRPIEMTMGLLEPESTRPPLMKHGRVVIRFLIMPDGKITGMNIESSSGDVAIDRAAYGTLIASSPLPPLPREFHGPYLALRGGFFYNPATGEMEREW
jgi:TonB family protein